VITKKGWQKMAKEWKKRCVKVTAEQCTIEDVSSDTMPNVTKKQPTMNNGSLLPQLLLSALFIVAYAALVYVIVIGDVETSDSTMPVLLIIVGSLTSSMTSVMAFWFGSSSGSKEKSRNGKDAH